MAELRLKAISYCISTAAAAPNSGGSVNMTVGLFAMMKFPGMLIVDQLSRIESGLVWFV